MKLKSDHGNVFQLGPFKTFISQPLGMLIFSVLKAAR